MALQNSVLDVLLEPDHEMSASIEQSRQQIEGEIPSIKKIRPACVPNQRGSRLQIMDFAGCRKDELLWHALHPIKDAGDFGCAGIGDTLPNRTPVAKA